MYTIEYVNEAVRLEIAALPMSLRVRYASYTERMQQFGANLGLPHTRAMGDGLFELRLKGAEGIARVFYCVAVERRIVVLHGFVKKTQATPMRELEIAKRRKKEVLNG